MFTIIKDNINVTIPNIKGAAITPIYYAAHADQFDNIDTDSYTNIELVFDPIDGKSWCGYNIVKDGDYYAKIDGVVAQENTTGSKRECKITLKSSLGVSKNCIIVSQPSDQPAKYIYQFYFLSNNKITQNWGNNDVKAMKFVFAIGPAANTDIDHTNTPNGLIHLKPGTTDINIPGNTDIYQLNINNVFSYLLSSCPILLIWENSVTKKFIGANEINQEIEKELRNLLIINTSYTFINSNVLDNDGSYNVIIPEHIYNINNYNTYINYFNDITENISNAKFIVNIGYSTTGISQDDFQWEEQYVSQYDLIACTENGAYNMNYY